MTRVAAIDCGTNSIRLLVADLDPDRGTATELDRRTEIVRLGQDVDRTGVFAAEALARTFGTCETYAGAIDTFGVERVRFVATSAARDVANRDEFARGVAARLGVQPDVISGVEEARLSFDGATRTLRAHGFADPFAVVDIGGGSTELVVGHGDDLMLDSVDIGSVRMTERHFHDDPPTIAQVNGAIRDIDAALDGSPVSMSDAATLVGVGGTATTVAAMVLGLDTYDSSRVHLARLPISGLGRAADHLLTMTRDERAALGFMQPGRADVIAAGALVFVRVAARFTGGSEGSAGKGSDAAGLVVSEHDILDGIAWSLA